MSSTHSLDERDLGLIEAFTRGDMAGFKYVYSLHRQRVFSYCLYYMGDHALAEDAFQETFVRVYTRREQLREAKALKSWILLITRSVCLNLLRESKFTPKFVQIESPEEIEMLGDTREQLSGPLESVIADDMLRAALAKIPPMYREAFLLCEFEGHDYAAIAEMTKTTEMNVRVRITRAKKQLRVLLAPHYKDDATLKGRKMRSRSSNAGVPADELEIENNEDESRGMEQIFAR